MFYETAKKDHGLPHDPFKAIVAPRPIGWLTTRSRKGEINLSPYSFFNGVCDNPPMVMFSSLGRKDAITFAEETGEFVCSLVTFDLKDKMNLTSAPLPRGENEMTFAGLTPAPSRLVAPPRVAESPCALECKLLHTLPLTPLGGGEPTYFMAIGQVVGVHIDERFIVDGMLDTAAMRTIARAGYHEYFIATPETRFKMQRPAGG